MRKLLAALALWSCTAPVASQVPPTTRARPPIVAAPARPRTVVTSGSIEIYETIQFVGNTAQLAEVSGPILDSIAETLRGNPSITLLEIRGHSDWEEPDRVRRAELSVERANNVVSALVERGVEAARLVAYGASDSEPVSTTDPVANRRIELLIRQRETD